MRHNEDHIEQLLVDWGRWYELHAKAYGWTIADVGDFDRVRSSRSNTDHSDPVMMEVSFRMGDSRMLAADRTIRYYLTMPQRKVILQRHALGKTIMEISGEKSDQPSYSRIYQLYARAKQAFGQFYHAELAPRIGA